MIKNLLKIIILFFPFCSIASDRYDPAKNILYINEVLVPNRIYKNVSLNVDRVVGVVGGTPQGIRDIYFPDRNELFIPSVSVGDTIYTNVYITIGPIISVGGFEDISIQVTDQTDRGGPAVVYNAPFSLLPSNVTPNDATISLYNDRRFDHITRRRSQDTLYTIQPKGNASSFKQESLLFSKSLENELSYGYIQSFIYYEKGVIKYNGKARDRRYKADITDETLFYTHSTGKSINSYVLAHAICEGFISSLDEVIDWPLMSKTLYHGQSIRELLNMRAGDKHTVDAGSSYVMGSSIHHRELGLDTIAALLEGTVKNGNEFFYNNFLSDVIANYIVYKTGNSYDDLMKRIFQDKVKIQHEMAYEKHKKTETNGRPSEYYGQLQTLSSFSYFITRMDMLRIAEAMMKDYQNQTCVGKYLKESQMQAVFWPQYRPNGSTSKLYLSNYSKKYGAQFYFDFHEMDGRNIFGTTGFNGQNVLIDMDNSRIVITNSAATAWDQKSFLLNVIKDGLLPN